MNQALRSSVRLARRGSLRLLCTCAAILACVFAPAGPAVSGTAGKTAATLSKQSIAAARQSAVRLSLASPEREASGARWADLAVAHARWLMSIPYGAGPLTDTTGVNCAINQDGPAWFLSGPAGTNYTTSCTVPHGKTIVASIIGYFDDYPCPAAFGFEPAPGQSLQEFLRADAAGIMDATTQAEAWLDGKPLKARRIATRLFAFTGAADLVTFDACVTGAPQVAVLDGYFAIIEGLSRGHHVLKVHSVGLAGTSDGTVNLKIE